MIQTDLSFHMDGFNRIELNIPDEPHYTVDEVEIWFVCDNRKICVFRDSWHGTFLTEVVHVVDRFRSHEQQNHYRPEELELRYFQHLTSGIINNSLWDYLLFSCKDNHVFLVENQDGCAVLVISEMRPYRENPEYRQIKYFILERASFLLWFDNLIKEMENQIIDISC